MLKKILLVFCCISFLQAETRYEFVLVSVAPFVGGIGWYLLPTDFTIAKLLIVDDLENVQELTREEAIPEKLVRVSDNLFLTEARGLPGAMVTRDKYEEMVRSKTFVLDPQVTIAGIIFDKIANNNFAYTRHGSLDGFIGVNGDSRFFLKKPSTPLRDELALEMKAREEAILKELMEKRFSLGLVF